MEKKRELIEKKEEIQEEVVKEKEKDSKVIEETQKETIAESEVKKENQEEPKYKIEESIPEENPSQGFPWIWISLALSFLAILIALFAFRESFIRNNLNKKVEPTPIPTIEPTPTIALKSDIKIQVLNASGKTGQAGKVKTTLEAIDFSNIETGNADIEKGETTVEYTSNFPSDYKTAISDELKKTYPKLEEQEIESTDFDCIITIKK